MKIHRIAALILIFAGLLPSISYGELGGDVTSIFSEQKKFNSQLSSTQQGEFIVYTQTLTSGIILQEYLSRNGTVFAVTWSGPALPNLQIVLGSYFKEYLAAIKESQRSISINTDSVIIQSSGMMGSFQGFGFLPKQAPIGFTSNNLNQ